jgi:hypothetical protein
MKPATLVYLLLALWVLSPALLFGASAYLMHRDGRS